MKQHTKSIILTWVGFICIVLSIVFASFLGYTISQEKVNIVNETIFGILTILSICGIVVCWAFAFLIQDKIDIYGDN